jgi:tRNA A37 methylthiotransferase MiaB
MTIFMETCAGKAREITAVGVSINPYLAETHRDNLAEINNRLQHITRNKYVKPLSSHEINTDGDMVHYTRETQLDILHKTLQHINTTPKN